LEFVTLFLSKFLSSLPSVLALPLLEAEKSHQLHSLEEEGGEDYEFNRRGPLSSQFAYVSTPWKKGTHPDESEDLFNNNVFLPDLGAPEAKTKPGPKTPPEVKPGPKAQPSAKKEAEEIHRSLFPKEKNHRKPSVGDSASLVSLSNKLGRCDPTRDAYRTKGSFDEKRPLRLSTIATRLSSRAPPSASA
jgi:hypothetical protein